MTEMVCANCGRGAMRRGDDWFHDDGWRTCNDTAQRPGKNFVEPVPEGVALGRNESGPESARSAGDLERKPGLAASPGVNGRHTTCRGT